MKHISYPKIQQFRNVVSDISKKITFIGLDDDETPMFDPSVPKPKITFKGTVKLHGTNAGVCYNSRDGVYVQSRNNAFGLDDGEPSQNYMVRLKYIHQVQNLYLDLKGENIKTH